MSKLSYKIEQDLDPESPREWDSLGTMICFHPDYSLGDEHNFSTPSYFWAELSNRLIMHPDFIDEVDLVKFEEAAHKRAIILPLYVYDHNSITMRTSEFSRRFDSGHVGYIYVTLVDIRKEYSVKRVTKKLRERVIQCLVNEVKVYDQFLTGEVYGFTIEDEDGEHVDSCWGFYGYDYCEEQAKDSLALEEERLRCEHQGKVKMYIRNHVPLEYRT